MKHLSVGLLFILILVPGSAECDVTVLHDHFEGSELDPEWVIHLDYDPPAVSWEHVVDVSNLTVTDVSGAVDDEWCAVRLRRACSLAGDFELECGLSWDTSTEPPDPTAMQRLRVSLVDTAGVYLAEVAYADAWIGYRGTRQAAVGGVPFDQGLDWLPYTGTATVRIVRSEDAVQVFWESDQLISGVEASRVDSLELSFWYYNYPDSFFGTESVDYVTVTAPESPVHAVSWARIKALFRS